LLEISLKYFIITGLLFPFTVGLLATEEVSYLFTGTDLGPKYRNYKKDTEEPTPTESIQLDQKKSNDTNKKINSNSNRILKIPTLGTYQITSEFTESTVHPCKGIFLKVESLEVLSARNGKIVSIDYLNGYNLVVVVQHENNMKTVYGNLNSSYVKIGDKIKTGEPIGNLLNNKNLYFQVSKKGNPINPLDLIEETKFKKI
jgi:murein DD-endopeptidase MepM/ murein hydrolase activator NlpD